MRRLPNLFLIGAQKGGSTKLFRYIVQHPQVNSLGTKEPNIFSAPSEAEARRRLEAIAPADESTRYLIDGSVDYSRYPRFDQTARHIHSICGDDLRFIYIMRHPVDRLISNYFWNRDRYGESRPLLQAIEQEPQYVHTSEYDRQIRAYAECFDLTRFCFLLFDDFVADSIATAGRVFDWLGLEPITMEAVGRTGTETNKKTTREARLALVNHVVWSSPAVRRVINNCVPQTWIRGLARTLTRDVPRLKVDRATRRHLLERYFMDSIVRTQQLTGLDLDSWLKSFRVHDEPLGVQRPAGPDQPVRHESTARTEPS